MSCKSCSRLLFLLLFMGTISCQQVQKNEAENSPDTQKLVDNTLAPLESPLKVAVIGLVHTHVHWILGREAQGDIEIVGIVEPNRQLAQQYSDQHGYSMDIVFDSMEELYANVQPEAVTAFNTIYGHLEVVQFFAPKGVHIMVEKPLAVNWEHAQKMAALAKKHNVHLLTNYETSWYGSHHNAFEKVIQEDAVGPIQRMVFHHGHPGPIEIGCNEEFLEWLTDPVLNGGGALTDFGCYGANLATWFLKGEHPEKVTCITRQYKPEKYPNVEDDATLVLDYKNTQVIIQASWNWSHNRKDMEVYGKTGYVICANGTAVEVLEDEEKGAVSFEAPPLSKGVHDPFAYLASVVKTDHPIAAFAVSSIENNMLVMQILEAAKASAESGKTISWDSFFTADNP